MINKDLELVEKVRKEYEFFTFIFFENKMTFGVVQNDTAKVLVFYDFLKLKDDKMKSYFLKCADQWWWQSSQTKPIDLFYGDDFNIFNEILICYPKKSFTSEPIGPIFSLNDLYLKKAKKKRIDLLSRFSEAQDLNMNTY